MPAIPFVGPSYASRSLHVDAQRCVNFYVEVDETKRGKSPSALYGTPGLKLFTTLGGTEGIRGNGLYTTYGQGGERTFAIRGATFYELFANGTAQSRGTLLTTHSTVCMQDNGLQLVIVDGTYGYYFTLADNTFARITDPDFFPADRVAFLDQYLLFNRSGTSQFFYSSLTGVEFDALDFASVEGFPDRLVSLLVIDRELRLFGATTTEPWFDVGDPENPFQRIQGAFLQQGIAGPHALAAIGDAHCWLIANNEGFGVVWMVAGGQSRRISTHAVESAIQGYETISDAIAWGEQREGHDFFWLTFPTASATWVYDITTGMWHERAWLNPATGALERHRANGHTVAFGKHLVGDWQNGNVYHLDNDTYSDNGQPLRAMRRAPYVYSGDRLQYVFHHALEVDVETGVGLSGTTEQTQADPQLMLRWSDDNGGTWVQERHVSLGKIGERQQRIRARFPRLGRSRARIYEVSISDPVKRVILGAYLDSEVALV